MEDKINPWFIGLGAFCILGFVFLAWSFVRMAKKSEDDE